MKQLIILFLFLVVPFITSSQTTFSTGAFGTLGRITSPVAVGPPIHLGYYGNVSYMKYFNKVENNQFASSLGLSASYVNNGAAGLDLVQGFSLGLAGFLSTEHNVRIGGNMEYSFNDKVFLGGLKIALVPFEYIFNTKINMGIIGSLGMLLNDDYTGYGQLGIFMELNN